MTTPESFLGQFAAAKKDAAKLRKVMGKSAQIATLPMPHAPAAPSEKLSGAERDVLEALKNGCPHPGTIQGATDRDWAEWAKELMELASHAETVPHAPAGQGEQS